MPEVYGEVGFKEWTTSRDAALVMTDVAGDMRRQVCIEIARAGPGGLTADEVAERLDKSVLAIRPRVSELANCPDPLIVPTGERRANRSGLKAKVWRTA